MIELTRILVRGYFSKPIKFVWKPYYLKGKYGYKLILILQRAVWLVSVCGINRSRASRPQDVMPSVLRY